MKVRTYKYVLLISLLLWNLCNIVHNFLYNYLLHSLCNELVIRLIKLHVMTMYVGFPKVNVKLLVIFRVAIGWQKCTNLCNLLKKPTPGYGILFCLKKPCKSTTCRALTSQHQERKTSFSRDLLSLSLSDTKMSGCK